MRLTECFDRVIVVPEALPISDTDELDALELCTHGVLLITPAAVRLADQHFDSLVEQLDSHRWSAVYLSHEVEVGESLEETPQLVRCAIPPTTVTALAVRPELLRHLLSVCADWGVTERLTPSDWLTMASWMLLDQSPAGTLWGAYPGLQPVIQPAVGLDGPAQSAFSRVA